MNDFKAITTVYSYYLPEVRAIISEMVREYPHDVFLQSISSGLDDFHHPIIEKLVEVNRTELAELSNFQFRYPTSGSEEGIREYFTLLRNKQVNQVYMWKGDYEGYREVAATRSIKITEVDYEVDPKRLKPGFWFLSNPSARDGMIVPKEKIQAILNAGHKVFDDLSYLRATMPHRFDLSHPNIDAVAVSFSKTYGLFYYRVGFLFSRETVPALYANKWFKNVFSLLVAERILDELDQAAMITKYKKIQSDIVADINGTFKLGVSASDAFLLAKLSAAAGGQLPLESQSLINNFRRGDWYRFCLTPYYMEYEALQS